MIKIDDISLFNHVVMERCSVYEIVYTDSLWRTKNNMEEASCICIDSINKTNGLIMNGKKEGLWREFYSNGQLQSEGTYKNGLKSNKYLDVPCNGVYRTWYDNGQLKSEILTFRRFKNQVLPWTGSAWSREGLLEVEYTESKLISDLFPYFPSIEEREYGKGGELREIEGHYFDTITMEMEKFGYEQLFYVNGQKSKDLMMVINPYKEPKKSWEGYIKRWDENGRLISHSIFSYDNIKGEECNHSGIHKSCEPKFCKKAISEINKKGDSYMEDSVEETTAEEDQKKKKEAKEKEKKKKHKKKKKKDAEGGDDAEGGGGSY